MDANTVIAVAATVVALASLAVAAYEARASRRHNRQSVRPVLQLRSAFHVGGTAGLRLTNVGLGPAVITGSHLLLDGEPVTAGGIDEAGINSVRDGLEVRPKAVTFADGSVLATDLDVWVLSVEPYDPDAHEEFYDLLRRRLTVEIRYESFYGEKFVTPT
ncbi:hypothetical protein Val02_91400 [Virgisporangium aliadipatigenens]|uniref:Uncharacterized protein n=1 Tax=Virgisporangium aliadipatigenens TaxID=741659 RepID=A0A8J4DVX0_9ACTN|nr:hypothetical protein [Virgisporangium aliadipatigenens]GIJ52254.1 hypothetical protein Val02_91400 [Virgisporangium aliadipatigenens]